MTLFTKPSPPGFYWNFLTQSHQPIKRQGPAHSYTTIDSGGVSVRGGGVSGGAPRKYTYAPGQPMRQRTPRELHDFLQRTYGAERLRTDYSALRQQHYNDLIPAEPVIQVAAEDALAMDAFNRNRDLAAEAVASGNLTVREDSAILDDTNPKSEEESGMKSVLTREEAEAAYKAAAGALAEIERLEQKYSADLSDGSVVVFRLTFPGVPTHYSYAAIRAAGQWFTTGKVHPKFPSGEGVDWAVLLACFEQYQATEFDVLRIGGDALELSNDTSDSEASTPVKRTVVLDPSSVISAFPKSKLSDEPQLGSDENAYRNEAPEQ